MRNWFGKKRENVFGTVGLNCLAGLLVLCVIVSFVQAAPKAPVEMKVVRRLDGEQPECRFGITLATLGDLNRDGIPDFVVGSPRAEPEGIDNQGSLFVFSGKDCQLLRRINGTRDTSNLGCWVNPAGDVNKDGVPDFLASSPNAHIKGVTEAGSLLVYSGADGTVLHRFDGDTQYEQWGNQGGAAGDVDGDGCADLVVGTIRHKGDTGCVCVYSGRTGAVLHRFVGPAPKGIMGHGVDGAGDLNGDGKADILVGVPGRPGPGQVFLFSGADGSKLLSLSGEAPGDGFGHRVSGHHDLNGDGTPDFVVSARTESGGDFGIVYAYSGKDNSLLWRLAGQNQREGLGFSAVRAIPDVNGDGCADLMVGSWCAPKEDAKLTGQPAQTAGAVLRPTPQGARGAGGRAYVLSGTDGRVLAYFDEKLPGGTVDCVDYLGDVNGDGRPEFLVGTGYADTRVNGHVYVVTADLPDGQAQNAQNPAVELLCGKCGAKLPPDAKFCPKCGEKVVTANPVKTPAATAFFPLAVQFRIRPPAGGASATDYLKPYLKTVKELGFNAVVCRARALTAAKALGLKAVLVDDPLSAVMVGKLQKSSEEIRRQVQDLAQSLRGYDNIIALQLHWD
ncbi:MAG: FG-GAP repeat protein, partial [Armatimonadetes bacterium]|nr:FG-GAP repeat protein [Armatimonadota bacterium]